MSFDAIKQWITDFANREILGVTVLKKDESALFSVQLRTWHVAAILVAASFIL